MSAPPSPTTLTEVAPAWEIAWDMAKRVRWIVPAAVALGAAWGPDGVASSLYGLAVVVVNFLVAAWLLTMAARVNVVLMPAAAMIGFLVRLGLIWAAVVLVQGASWLEPVPLAITLIATHLGLLAWEARFVSGSYAYPGVKPTVRADQSAPAA